MVIMFIPKFFSEALALNKITKTEFFDRVYNKDGLLEYLKQFSKYDIVELITTNYQLSSSIYQNDKILKDIEACHIDYETGVIYKNAQPPPVNQSFIKTFSIEVAENNVFILMEESFPESLIGYEVLLFRELSEAVLKHRGESDLCNFEPFRKLITLKIKRKDKND